MSNSIISTFTTNEYVVGSNEVCVVYRDKRYKPDGTKRPIIWCHEHGGQAAFTPFEWANGWPDLADLGPVFCADLGGPSTWGNTASIARVNGLITWAGSVWGTRTDQVLLYGGSMGTITALDWAKVNPSKVGGIAIMLPAVNLDAIHAMTYLGTVYGPIIDAAYGGNSAYVAAEPFQNPQKNQASFVPLANKMKLWYSTNDPIALPSEVLTFAAGVGCATRPVGDIGHSFLPPYNPREVYDFFRGLP